MVLVSHNQNLNKLIAVTPDLCIYYSKIENRMLPPTDTQGYNISKLIKYLGIHCSNYDDRFEAEGRGTA